MKYKFWDVSRDRRKAPVTKSDRLLEWVALFIAIVALVLTGVLYVRAPETVPSHFNYKGEADGWSGKYIYCVSHHDHRDGIDLGGCRHFHVVRLPGCFNRCVRLHDQWECGPDAGYGPLLYVEDLVDRTKLLTLGEGL